MNLERRGTENDISAKNNNQRVSVIRWSGRKSTLSCHEKSGIEEDAPSPVVKEKLFVSSYSVAKQSQSNKYQCSFCNKSFKWYSHWKSHERTHTGERPFKCEICGKAFVRSDGLQCHKLTHITPRYRRRTHREKNDHTQPNATSYNYYPSLESGEHMPNSVRSLERRELFNCDLCSRSFFSSAGLLKHMHAHEGK